MLDGFGFVRLNVVVRRFKDFGYYWFVFRQIVIMVVLVGSCLHMLPSLSLFFLQYLQVSSSPKRVKDGRSFHGYALGPASSPKL